MTLDLFETVTFYSPAPGSDGYGGQVDGWQEEFSARANFRFLRGGETVQAARLAGMQPAVVTVRASADAARVRPAWKLTDRAGADFNIRSVVRSDDRLYLEITAESGVEV